MKTSSFMFLGRDGHIYLWNKSKHKYIEARYVEIEEIPYDVKQQIRQKREDAVSVLEMPEV
jgi:hypothetical protein